MIFHQKKKKKERERDTEERKLAAEAFISQTLGIVYSN